MGVNRGKDFEKQVRNGFERVPDTTVTRLLDPQAGYAGVRNICDFIVYHNPHQYFLECKSCYGNTLPFTNITQNQWDGLLKMSKVSGVMAGYLVWFIDHDKTFYVSATLAEKYRKSGKKSLRYDDKGLFEIDSVRKRVVFDYDFSKFFGEYL